MIIEFERKGAEEWDAYSTGRVQNIFVGIKRVMRVNRRKRGLCSSPFGPDGLGGFLVCHIHRANWSGIAKSALSSAED